MRRSMLVKFNSSAVALEPNQISVPTTASSRRPKTEFMRSSSKIGKSCLCVPGITPGTHRTCGMTALSPIAVTGRRFGRT
jgi:hypothetical protein